MFFLSLDTSSDTCSAALWQKGKIDSISKKAPREHTHLLLPMIQTLLERNHCRLAECTAIAFGEGPGSFTGLRITASVAQGLAFAHQLPLIPISTLAALARAAQKQFPQATCALPILDARMSEVYVGLYDLTHLLPHPLQADALISPQYVVDAFSPKLPQAWVGIGAGFNAYEKILSSLPKALALLPNLDPNAIEIAELAVDAFEKGKHVSATEALPNYLRNDVAHKPSSKV